MLDGIRIILNDRTISLNNISQDEDLSEMELESNDTALNDIDVISLLRKNKIPTLKLALEKISQSATLKKFNVHEQRELLDDSFGDVDTLIEGIDKLVIYEDAYDVYDELSSDIWENLNQTNIDLLEDNLDVKSVGKELAKRHQLIESDGKYISIDD